MDADDAGAMKRIAAILAIAAGTGCVPADDSHHPYAAEVVSFVEGDNAGYGADGLPDNVLGAPNGAGTGQGATEGVLSLGVGGEIVLAFDEPIPDLEGPDLVVFENPFLVAGTDDQVWAEFGEVSVSSNGREWQTFSCDPDYNDRSTWPGCAGWSPVLEYDPEKLGDTIDPSVTGGDVFDFATIDADDVRFVRIRDLAKSGVGPSAGFDLDAMAGVYSTSR